jgi:hypothetical protein
MYDFNSRYDSLLLGCLNTFLALFLLFTDNKPRFTNKRSNTVHSGAQKLPVHRYLDDVA